MRDGMLFVHFIGLAMGIGTSFAYMFLGMASSKMEKEEGIKFNLNTFALSKMGYTGLLLLIISGGYLMTPYWKVLGEMPMMIAKLCLVLALGALLGIIGSLSKKARKGDAEAYLKKIKPLGMLAMLVGLAIVALGVFTFH